jgi:ankyrin repeat protein
MSRRADADVQMHAGATPLHLASQTGHADITQTLLESRALVDIKLNGEYSPLMLTSKHGHDKVAQLLLQYRADAELAIQKTGWNSLMYASHSGHDRVVQVLLEHSAIVDAISSNGRDSLILAAQEGHEAVMCHLLEFKADPGMVWHSGWNSLHLACQRGLSKAVEAIFASGSTACSAVGENGWTALHLAVQNRHMSTVQVLLEQKAPVDTQHDARATALHVACQCGFDDIARLLLESGARVDIFADGETTPLHMASQAGQTGIVQLLLERKAGVDVPMQGGTTALHLACQHGFANLAKLLLCHKASIDLQVHSGWSALMLSCRNGHTDAVRVLLSAAADANLPMQSGQVALHFACQYGFEPIVRLLLDAKADVSPGLSPTPVASTSLATTSWTSAATSGDCAKRSLPSPLKIAKRCGHDGIASLLSEYQTSSEARGFCASGLMLALPGVPYDASTQRFYFSNAVHVDLDSSHFPWNSGDFTVTATITPRCDGKVASMGEYAVLFAKSDQSAHPFMGLNCLVYNSGMVQFRLARTTELGQENKGMVRGGWRSGVPVKLTFIRQLDQLYIFQDAEQIAFQCVTDSFDINNSAPLRIGGNHINPKHHCLDAYLSGLSSHCTAIFPVQRRTSAISTPVSSSAPADLS